MASSFSGRNGRAGFIIGTGTGSDQEALPIRPRKPYVHARWAGGPSDVWKQVVLSACLRELPVRSYWETHAGAGLHLVRPYAAWREGIGAHIARGPQSVLCRIVASHAEPWLMQRGWQPGSWHLAASLLVNRRLEACFNLWERDPLVYEDACRVAASLEATPGPVSVRVKVERGDGFQALLAELYAPDFVLIDPPYILDGSGLEGDWEVVARVMAQLAMAREPALAWYPVFGEERARMLIEGSQCDGYELILGKARRGRDVVPQGSGMLATPELRPNLQALGRDLAEAAQELGGRFCRRHQNPNASETA